MPKTGYTKFIPRTSEVIQSLTQLWQLHPALFYGLSCLLGCGLTLGDNKIALLLPTGLLVIPPFFTCCKRQAGMALLLISCSSLYCHTYYYLPSLPHGGLMGTARITIQSVSDNQSHLGPSWVLKGTIDSFIPRDTPQAGSIARGVPYRLTIPANGTQPRPTADCGYSIPAKLKISPSRSYQLSVNKNAIWEVIPYSWSLAELRYHAKKRVGDYIHHHVSDQRAAGLLTGLVTGEFSDRQTRLSLGRFGLQHILAISGFHFAILAGLLSMALMACMPFRWALISLLTVLGAYCLFLGYGPSIMRAWLAITIALLGQLLCRNPRGLNSMGMAMIIILVMDPLACLSPAFQLSFLATSAILTLYQPMDRMVMTWWPMRPLSRIMEMTRLDQHGYLILNLCRQALALTLAVHLVTVPVCLWYFGKFPLLSLLYNLFFPFLVSASMLLLVIASLLQADWIHALNGAYTHFILNITFNTPTWMDLTLRVSQLSLSLVIAFLTFVLVVGVHVRRSVCETCDS